MAKARREEADGPVHSMMAERKEQGENRTRSISPNIQIQKNSVTEAKSVLDVSLVQLWDI